MDFFIMFNEDIYCSFSLHSTHLSVLIMPYTEDVQHLPLSPQKIMTHFN